MNEQQRHWFKQGMLFGYPDCCIEAFITLNHLGSDARKLNGTGFIPCAKCNHTKTEEEMIYEINLNRYLGYKPFKALEPEIPMLYMVMGRTTKRVYEHNKNPLKKETAELYAHILNQRYYRHQVAISFYVTPILDI